MGYFDGLTAASFKRDAEGRELFFFWGKFGKGRIIPTGADGAWARKYVKIFYVWLIFGNVPIFAFAGESFQPPWFGMLGALVALDFVALVPLWLRTRAWEVSDERMTYRESMSAFAQAFGAPSLWFLILLSILMTAGSLFVLLETEATMLGVGGVLFFGGGLCIFVWMLIARRYR